MKKRHPVKDNILLVNITRLGDMLQATPTIAGMKKENPNSKITVLVEKQFESVCHIIPNIDEIMSIDLGMTVRSLAREQDGVIDAYDYVTELVEDLKKKNFDYTLNMSSSAYTALLIRTVGIPRSGGWTADEEGYRSIQSDWAKLFASSVYHQNRQFNSLNLVDVFRASADVDQHPHELLINLDPNAVTFCEELLREARFTNTGPLIAVQAGASQGKRQWAPRHFIEFINILVNRHNARVVLTGTKKELPIVEAISNGCNSPNIFISAGKTSIPQLTALLKMSDLLVTGDTGPMHISAAVGTPVVSMFLASAFGYETGPYRADNIVIQPIIGCGPCNPNKSCARPDCHDTIPPEALAKLIMMRLDGPITSLPNGIIDPNKMTVYSSLFDKYGFCDLKPLHQTSPDRFRKFRDAYRKTWLDDLGGFEIETSTPKPQSALKTMADGIEGLEQVVALANQGTQTIKDLIRLIDDVKSPHTKLGEATARLGALDVQIEQLGFHYNHLGPVTRMFVFSKENLSGTDARSLASQMGGIYDDLTRRCEKFNHYYQSVS